MFKNIQIISEINVRCNCTQLIFYFHNLHMYISVKHKILI